MKHALVPAPREGALSGRVAAMRAEFDGAFAQPVEVRDTGEARFDVLELTLGDERCLFRLTEIGEVVTRPALTAVPTSSPTLVGLACSRDGTVVAVHDLAGLLGRPRERPHWMVVPRAAPGLGIAFEHFTGHRKLGPADPDTSLILSLSTVAATAQTSRETAR